MWWSGEHSCSQLKLLNVLQLFVSATLCRISTFISLFSRKQSTTPFQKLRRKWMGMIYNVTMSIKRFDCNVGFGTKPCGWLSERSSFRWGTPLSAMLTLVIRPCKHANSSGSLRQRPRKTNETPRNGSSELVISNPPVKTTAEKEKNANQASCHQPPPFNNRLKYRLESGCANSNIVARVTG